MLARLARFSFRRRWIMVLGIWVPLLVALNVLSGVIGTDYRAEFNMPDSESTLVQDAFTSIGSKEDAGLPGTIVFSAEQGNNDPAVRAAMEALFAKVEALPEVKLVSPYSPEGSQFNSPAGSPSNTIAADVSFAKITITRLEQSEMQKIGDSIIDLGDTVDVPGLRIEYGGPPFQKLAFPASELLGLLAAIIVLLLAFGSVIAMGLPIGTAIIGLGAGLAVVALVSRLVAIPEVATPMAAMIGLGVGIDYALFIVSRYREHLEMGEDPENAAVNAVNSSGRAVLFAGITVIISLLGLFIMGLSFVRGLAIASAIAVLVMMVAAISLLPALIGFAGTRIHTTSRAAAAGVGLFVLCGLVGVAINQPGPLLGAGLIVALALMGLGYVPGLRALRRPLPPRREKKAELRFWFRWSRFIQRRPWPFFIGGAAVLMVLALPLFSLRLGFSDEGNLPKDTTMRQAYDLVSGGFGPGSNGQLVMVSTDPGVTPEISSTIDAALTNDSNVAFAVPGREIAPDVWLWSVYPKTAPQDEATTDLVFRLRDEVLPDSGVQVNVGGATASAIDFSDFVSGRLVYLIGAVLALSFLLLMAVFRSLLVPLKAVIMNLLSVGAAYGVIVAIFQWGWGMHLFGVDRAGPIEAWAPMMLFAIVFGLSMDYEVFLLSRMKEEYDRTGDNGTAVADGLAATARVITAAAIIMVCVFAAFVLGNDRSLKLFGLGLAVAVFVDATIVRMLLVPATMELLGARNWWLPKWIDRLLPRLDVEGAHPQRHDDDAILDEIEREEDRLSQPV